MSTATKTAILTGASGGIGKVVARRLAADGFAVVANYAGSANGAEELVKAITASGGQAVAVQADVARPEQVTKLFEQAATTFGSVDVVVHTAGIMPLSPIANGDVELFDRVISTNLRGSFLVMAEAAKRIAQDGRIIMFSSSVLGKNFPGYGAYIASKSGVEGMVRVLANEMRGRRVTVNALAPGPIGTPLFLNGKSEAQIDEFRKMNPLERLGTPEDIAGVVSFLAGPDGAWVNGQVLRANGGFA